MLSFSFLGLGLMCVCAAGDGPPISPLAVQSETSDPQQLLADFSKKWDESKWEKGRRGGGYMRATGDAGWKYRMRVLRALVLGGEKSVPALTAALESKDEPTRILAAQALSYLGPQADLQRLKTTVMNDESAAVRLYAVDAIGMSGKSKSVNWGELSQNQRNRDVVKHINYATLRENNGVSKDVIAALRNWDPKTLDAARVGSPAPDFRLKTIDGDQVALSDFRGKQPVVLVFIYGDT